jgi:hypothetical protein
LPARAAISPGVPVVFSQNGKAACAGRNVFIAIPEY